MDKIINLTNIDKALRSLTSSGNWDQTKSEILSIEVEKLDIFIKKLKFKKPINPALLHDQPDFNYLQKIGFYCFSYFLAPHNSTNVEFLTSKKKALRIAGLIFELLGDGILDEEKIGIRRQYYFYSILAYHGGGHLATACTLAKRIAKDDGFGMEDIFIKLLSLDFKGIFKDKNKFIVESDNEKIRVYKENIISFASLMLYGSLGDIHSIITSMKSIEYLSPDISSSELFIISKTIEFIQNIFPNSIWQILPPLGFQEDYLKILSLKDRNNIYVLWESQREIIETVGFWDKERVHINLPTSGGKTFLSELLIYKALLQGKKCIYVVPKNALLNEVEDMLFKRFRFLNKKVSASIGYNSTFFGSELDSDILVLTPEKLDLIIRNAQEILSDIGIFIFDEFHTIESEDRGILLETLIAFLIYIQQNYSYKIITMSAILDDVSSVKLWFGDDGVFAKSNYIPVRKTYALVEEFHSNQERKKFHLQFYYQKGLRKINVDMHSDLRLNPNGTKSDLALAILSKVNILLPNKKVLVYFFTKKTIESFIKKYIRTNPIISEDSYNYDGLKSLLSLIKSKIGDDHLIYKSLQRGVGFHNADLPLDIRKEIEFAYRNNYINTLVATTSLAEGVNLPISIIILGELGNNGHSLSIGDYRNIIGRTGRAMVDTEGIVILSNYRQGPRVKDYFTNTSLIQIKSSLDITQLISLLEEDLYDIEMLSRVQVFIYTLYQQLLTPGINSDYISIKEIINKMPLMNLLNDTIKEEFHSKYTLKIYNDAKELSESGKLSIYNRTGLSAKSNHKLLLIIEGIALDIGNFEFDSSNIFTSDEIVSIADIFLINRYIELIEIREFKPSIVFDENETHYHIWLDWLTGMSFSELRDKYFHIFPNPTSVTSKYIAEEFEYRLPWALGIIFSQLPTNENPFINDLMETLSIRTRYGVKDGIEIKLIQLGIEDRYMINELKRAFELYNQPIVRIDSIIDWIRDISFSYLERQIPILRYENSLVRRLSRIKSSLRIKTSHLIDDGELFFPVSGVFRGKYFERLGEVTNNALLSLNTEDNSYDPFAVRIDYNGIKLGYVPSKYAEEISEYVEGEIDLSLSIISIIENEIIVKIRFDQ